MWPKRGFVAFWGTRQFSIDNATWYLMENNQLRIAAQRPGVAVRRLVLRHLDNVFRLLAETENGDASAGRRPLRNAASQFYLSLKIWRNILAPEVKSRDFEALKVFCRALKRAGEAYDTVQLVNECVVHSGSREQPVMDLLTRVDREKGAWLDALDRSSERQALLDLLPALRMQLCTYREEISVLKPEGAPFSGTLSAALCLTVDDLDLELNRASSKVKRQMVDTVRRLLTALISLASSVRRESDLAERVIGQCRGLVDQLQPIYLYKKFLRRLPKEITRIGPHLAGGVALADFTKAVDFACRDASETFLQTCADGAFGLLSEDVRSLASALEPHENVEIERKYLLSGLPPKAREGAKKRLWQGYLPGKRLIERIRRIRMNGADAYVRTVKLGRGLARVEVEERCDEKLFLALWPLTQSRRVEKIRYDVPAGRHTWEIDEFTDRNLYLAEIELSNVEERIAVPDWLAPFVIREVTHEDAYVNRCLAR